VEVAVEGGGRFAAGGPTLDQLRAGMDAMP
jgi:hypothetical protein